MKAWLAALLFSLAVLSPALAQSRGGGADLMLQTISAIPGNEGKRYAICIGINDYEDREIVDLNAAKNDAIALANALTEAGQFDQVVVLTDDVSSRDQTGRYPSKRNIREQLDRIEILFNPNDLVVVSFAGHGVMKGEDGYLLPIDAYYSDVGGTSLRVKDILDWLEHTGVRKSLLLLDACRENLTEEISRGLSRKRLGPEDYQFANVSAVFYSTRAGLLSYEDVNSDHGVFTRFLLEGIRGKADYQYGNSDGIVSFRELASFLEEAVTNYAYNRNWRQKPEAIFTGETFADLALSTYGGRIDGSAKALAGKNFGSGEGTINLYSNVDGEVLLDDKPKGRITAGEVLTFKRVPAGPHFLEIDHKYGRYRNEAEVYAGKVTELANKVVLEEQDIRTYEGINFMYVSGQGGTAGFWMSETEISLGHFALFVEDSGYRPEGVWDKHFKTNFDYFPVTNVSKKDAESFAAWLAGLTGKDIALPTQQQWEYAAGKKYGRIYPWGNTWHADYCHSLAGSPRGMLPVTGGRGPVQVFDFFNDITLNGITGMAGNVREWLQDDQKAGGRTFGLIAGGGWTESKSTYFAADYSTQKPVTYTEDGVGFRLVIRE
ncbi:MAG: hypothetical protein E4H36_05390 [Spirochaetales bacterium]|nr:MAG: hypothetical protein E4H36_05390 [Spirochaetales bacterium]